MKGKKQLQKYARKIRKQKISLLIKKNWKILDVGCGDGWLVNFLKKEGFDCVGVDRNAKPPNIKADARELPFKDNTFDCVICIHSLEHVICDYEIKRILKNRGLLIIEVPAIQDFVFKILDKLSLIGEGVYEHVRFVYFERLPFKLIDQQRILWGLSKWGLFENEK